MSANPRPNILLLIPHLGGGGAERVTSLLARCLSSDKYELHLGLITQTTTSEALPALLHIHCLGAHRVRASAFRLLRLVRRLKPELILSGMAHLNFLVLLLRPLFPRGSRVLVRQNATISATLASGAAPRYTRLLYRMLYRHADVVICQTQSMAEDLARELGVSKNRLTVMPNPVDVEEIRAAIGLNSAPYSTSGPGPHLLAVGRLAKEKGFDLLLKAMVSIRREFPQASLLIAGAGPEEAALKAECHALQLDEAVRFAGSIGHPWTLFPAATLFVLPSRHEGLPNAMLEAAAAGLPIVALPASGGVARLLRNQPGVWLASTLSEDALAASLLAALHALRPGERFTHSFVEAFRLDRAIHAYEILIDRTLGVNQ
jgi:glycosyltransferase involved in cell wall biosynthesis